MQYADIVESSWWRTFFFSILKWAKTIKYADIVEGLSEDRIFDKKEKKMALEVPVQSADPWKHCK
jgi:hypothetical protein